MKIDKNSPGLTEHTGTNHGSNNYSDWKGYIIEGNILSEGDLVIELNSSLTVRGCVFTKGSVTSNTSIYCHSNIKANESISINGNISAVNITLGARLDVDGDVTARSLNCWGKKITVTGHIEVENLESWAEINCPHITCKAWDPRRSAVPGTPPFIAL